MAQFCSKCDKSLDPHDKFCGSCGTRVNSHNEPDRSSPSTASTGELHSGTPVATQPRGEALRRLQCPPQQQDVQAEEHRHRARTSSGPQSIEAPRVRKKSPCIPLRTIPVVIVLAIVVFAVLPFLVNRGTKPNLGLSPSVPVAGGKSAPEEPRFIAGPALQTAPAQVLRDESGGAAHVPERLISDLGTVTWKVVPKPPELERIALVGQVMCFESQDSLVIGDQVSVDLPKPEENVTVLMQGRMGLWVPMQTSTVTLENGQPGLRVTIDNEPTPWLFAVSNDASVAELPDDPIMSRLLRFEREFISRKSEAPLKQLVRGGERKDVNLQYAGWGGSAIHLGATQAYAADRGTEFDDRKQFLYDNLCETWAHLRETAYWYAEVRKNNLEGEARGQAINAAWKSYRKGLNMLQGLRRLDSQYRSTRFTGWNTYGYLAKEAQQDEGSWTADTMIQDMASFYAPWGIDFTSQLIRAAEGWQETGPVFDLRVLDQIGDLKFVDVMIPESRTPQDFRLRRPLQDLRTTFGPEDFRQASFLRLFSSGGVNVDVYHWFLDFADGRVLRWGPVIYGAVQYIGLTGTAVSTGGLSLLGAFVWAAVEEGLDWMPANPETSAHSYMRFQYLSKFAPELTKEVVVRCVERNLYARSMVSRIGPHDVHENAMSLFAGIFISYLMQKSDHFFIKEISAIPTGRGSYRRMNSAYLSSRQIMNMPPVLFHCYLHGREPEKDPGLDYFPVYKGVSVVYHLAYDELYDADLPDLMGQPTELSDGCSQIPEQLPLRPFRPGSEWPTYLQDQKQDHQFIRVGLSRQFIERRLEDLGRAGSVSWQDVPLVQLNLSVMIQSRDNDFRLFEPLEDVTTSDDLRKEARYTAIHIRRYSSVGEIPTPPGYIQRFGAHNSIKRPRTQYELALTEIDNETNRAHLVTSPIRVECFNVPEDRVKNGKAEYADPPDRAWVLLDVMVAPAKVELSVTALPQPLDQARPGETYKLQVRASGIPASSRQVKVAFTCPGLYGGRAKVIPHKNDNGVCAVQFSDIRFDRPVEGTAYVRLLDESDQELAAAEVLIQVRDSYAGWLAAGKPKNGTRYVYGVDDLVRVWPDEMRIHVGGLNYTMTSPDGGKVEGVAVDDVSYDAQGNVFAPKGSTARNITGKISAGGRRIKLTYKWEKGLDLVTGPGTPFPFNSDGIPLDKPVVNPGVSAGSQTVIYDIPIADPQL